MKPKPPPPPAERDTVYAPIAKLKYTNDRPKRHVVDSVARHFDPDKFEPIVIYQLPDGMYIITDGNHRAEGFQVAGYSHIYAVLLTEAEYKYIAFSHRHITIPSFLPDHPRILP